MLGIRSAKHSHMPQTSCQTGFGKWAFATWVDVVVNIVLLFLDSLAMFQVNWFVCLNCYQIV